MELCWLSYDPKAEKYYNISPQSFLNDNPVRYVDPTGMQWEDPKDAEKLNKSVNRRITSINNDNAKIQSQIDKGGLSEKKLEKLLNKIEDNNGKVSLLNQSLSDIKAIGDSKEIFTLTTPSKNDGRHSVVKGSDGVIKIEGSNSAIHLHEIRHIGQSISNGGLKFNEQNILLNSAKTQARGIVNEINAYQVQYSFDSSYPGGASSLKDINSNSLMQIKDDNEITIYGNSK